MSDESKIAILSQEVRVRMMNTSEEEEFNIRLTIINNFDEKLIRSGYNREERRKIFTRGLTGYESTRRQVLDGERVLHRHGKKTINSRYKKKLIEKNTW